MSIEEVINRVARTEEEKKSLKELITSTTIKQLAAYPQPSTTKKTPRSLLPQLSESPAREYGHKSLEVLHHHKHQKNQNKREQSPICLNLKKLLELHKSVQAKAKRK